MQKPPRKLPIHKMIPNMITLTAMAVGLTSIKFAIAGKWEHAVIAIVVAAFMDAFDGAAARLLKAQSKLGAELDSFSDLVCFGVAPALVIYLWALEAAALDGARWAWPVALVFAMAVTLRLARFNIASEEGDLNDPMRKYFTGVPSPVGAGLCLLPMIVSFQTPEAFGVVVQNPIVVGLWAMVVAAMMVSNIPTFSSKQVHISYKLKIPALGLFAILLAGLINATWPTLTLIGVAYLLAMPFGVRHYQKRAAAYAAGQKDMEADDTED
ncbi:MAG: phosphatidylcholine/phosphatidylserine synthase [Alphaproteobacteria bacterium]|nr:phosphatidylcholine/phosphatidylserine synthase [Alphaproteobacteria bacterium]